MNEEVNKPSPYEGLSQEAKRLSWALRRAEHPTLDAIREITEETIRPDLLDGAVDELAAQDLLEKGTMKKDPKGKFSFEIDLNGNRVRLKSNFKEEVNNKFVKK